MPREYEISCLSRVRGLTGLDILRRFTQAMQDYGRACAQQVNMQSGSAKGVDHIDALLELRRGSIASTPIFALVECASYVWCAV